jgi:hypothetical protein
MAIAISYALTPVNYILVCLCLYKGSFSVVESLMNDDAFMNFTFCDSKRLKFALFSWFFLEMVFFVEHILILGVMISPKHNEAWGIKKPHLSYPSSELVGRYSRVLVLCVCSYVCLIFMPTLADV